MVLDNAKGCIVYFGAFELPDRNAAAHRVLNNAKAFRDLGYKVIFSGADKTIGVDRTEPDDVFGFASYPQAYPTTTAQWLKSLVSAKHMMRVLEAAQDVRFVVAYNMHAGPLFALMKYCRKHGIRLIADATEWYENRFSLSPAAFARWFDTQIVMKKLQIKVDGMISISTYLTEYYRPFVGNIVQIPPLVDTDEAIWSAKSSDRSETVEFVYTGVPGNTKDKIDVILNAFSSVKGNFLLTIVGITKEQCIRDFPSSAETIEKLKDNIVFRGRVSHEESSLALKKADYCIFIRESSMRNNAGFPTKFAECLTAGIGVIASSISNIRDYFPFENGYLLGHADVDTIRDTIGRCIEGGKIRHTPGSMFDYRMYEGELERFFASVALSEGKSE